MFVEQKAAGEAPLTKEQQLGAAILAGADLVEESKHTFYTEIEYGKPLGCALGTAAAALGYNPGRDFPVMSFLQAKGFSLGFMNRVSRVHCGGVSRQEIASMLLSGKELPFF